MTISVSDAPAANGHEKSSQQNFEPRLTSEESSKIQALSESVVSKGNIVAVCAYGSRVAGFAGKDSDYDIIIIAKNIEAKLISKLETTPIKSSVLIVDESELLEEAQQFSNREFAVGRLLNIYEPIVNAQFLRNVEIDYKKRIVAEELSAIQDGYGFFSPNLIVPLRYFLFKRLQDRALFFPTIVSSLARTYSGAMKEENIGFSLDCFRIAVGMLESDGLIETKNDAVRLLKGKRGADAVSRLRQRFRIQMQALGQNLPSGTDHQLASELKGRPSSNWEKVKGNVQCDQEFDCPNKLLQLEEGVFLDGRDKIAQDIAQLYRFDDEYKFKEKKLGGLINSSSKLEIWDSRRKSKFVLKQFGELQSAKWAFLNTWAVLAKQFSMSPIARLSREVEGVRWMHELGINTHRITGVALKEKILVTEYVEGEPLIKFVQEILDGYTLDTGNIEKYGGVLGKMHKAGLMYGDTKPQNALVGDKGIYLLDLEQSVENGDAAWDIAEFLYYSAAQLEEERKDRDVDRFSSPNELTAEERMALVARAFLDIYVKENDNETIAKARSARYLTPFLPLLDPGMIYAIGKVLEEYSPEKESL